MTTTAVRASRWPALLVVAAALLMQALIGTPAAAQPGSCKEPPSVETPGSGMVALFDQTPLGQGTPGSAYDRYGYAGTIWHTYDVGSPLTGCYDPLTGTETWFGNKFFDAAKLIVGITNSLYYTVQNGGLFDRFDDLVNTGTVVLYEAVFLPYVALGLIIVAMYVLVQAYRGDIAGNAKTAARVATGLAVACGCYLTPLLYTSVLDDLVMGGVQDLQANVFGQISPEAGGADALPTMLHEQIVYNNWLRGEFGSATDPQAQQLGMQLLDAQACTKEQREQGCAGALIEAKQQAFQHVASQIEAGGNYEAFTGTAGQRIAFGLFALAQAICYALFQLVCGLGVVFFQLILRVVVLVGPVVGLLGFAPGVLRTTFRAVAGAAVQGLILTCAALVHALVMTWVVQSSQLPMGGVMVLMAVLTVLAWRVVRPTHRLHNMASLAIGLPKVGRDQRRLEQLLKRQHQRDRGTRMQRLGWWLTGEGQRPQRGATARPETDNTVHEAETVDPSTEVVPSYRRPETGSVDAEWWSETTERPAAPQRAALRPAQRALPGASAEDGSTSAGPEQEGPAAPQSPGGAGAAASLPRAEADQLQLPAAPETGSSTPSGPAPSGPTPSSGSIRDASQEDQRQLPVVRPETHGPDAGRVYRPSSDTTESSPASEPQRQRQRPETDFGGEHDG